MESVLSINQVPIRLTNGRWHHISLGHPEMAAWFDDILSTIEKPHFVYQGKTDEYLAVKQLDENKDKYIVVIYKELNSTDGFVTTSFITNKKPYFEKKKLIWKQ